MGPGLVGRPCTWPWNAGIPFSSTGLRTNAAVNVIVPPSLDTHLSNRHGPLRTDSAPEVATSRSLKEANPGLQPGDSGFFGRADCAVTRAAVIFSHSEANLGAGLQFVCVQIPLPFAHDDLVCLALLSFTNDRSHAIFCKW